jgi:hypothetical protein
VHGPCIVYPYACMHACIVDTGRSKKGCIEYKNKNKNDEIVKVSDQFRLVGGVCSRDRDGRAGLG